MVWLYLRTGGNFDLVMTCLLLIAVVAWRGGDGGKKDSCCFNAGDFSSLLESLGGVSGRQCPLVDDDGEEATREGVPGSSMDVDGDRSWIYIPCKRSHTKHATQKISFYPIIGVFNYR